MSKEEVYCGGNRSLIGDITHLTPSLFYPTHGSEINTSHLVPHSKRYNKEG